MGKVHGSLARAGKVKSQTPKVHTPGILASAFEIGARKKTDWLETLQASRPEHETDSMAIG
jgi:Ribosomal protein S30